MVTRSIDDWETHKADVYEVLLQKFEHNGGEKRANKFLDHYEARYDRFGRSFIDYKLAILLMDEYSHVRDIGTRWYACVGPGGTGKTTLMKNILYFLDDRFDLGAVTTEMDGFVRILKRLDTVKSMRGILLDEPDDVHAAQSKQGKILRRICGKARQQHLFLGFCATDLKDIPTYIYRKIDVIIFTRALGHYQFYRNWGKKNAWPVQQIRDQYAKEGYGVFEKHGRSRGCLKGTSIKGSPIDLAAEKEYLKRKRKDYETDIDKYIKKAVRDGDEGEKIDQRTLIMKKMREKGLSMSKIGEYMGVSQGRVSQIIGKPIKISD